ncbi:hypothetical protein ANN_24900 [Periplaneta americana]|uniref:Uncharacterized protein n=1 Tax=Periplaneta americana TaxID=6978 RepID=A0ABQ8S029_PERAM|nr:hypothetical protein ANN_24900 [Periplaneta americana]
MQKTVLTKENFDDIAYCLDNSHKKLLHHLLKKTEGDSRRPTYSLCGDSEDPRNRQLKDYLQVMKCCDRWVPHSLTEKQMAARTAKSDLDSVNGVDRSVVESAESGEEPSSFLAEDAIDESINSIGSTCKEPGDEEQESSVDVNAQQEQANNKIKVSAGSCKAAKSDSGGTKYGDTSKSTSTKDKTLSTEDKKVPVPTSQSSQVSQPVNAGVRGNGASTRSTRSQNPEFLARHRNFLHKIHLASNNATDEELFTDDDESTASKATTRSGGSVQTEENSNSVVDGMAVRRKRERSASNGTLSPRIPSPSVVNMISGSASANNSDGSSPATSQMQPAIKKRRSTRSESSGPLHYLQIRTVSSQFTVLLAQSLKFTVSRTTDLQRQFTVLELRSSNCGPLHSNSGLQMLTQLQTHSSQTPVSKLASLLHKIGWLAVH